jgi:hypothetical protein
MLLALAGVYVAAPALVCFSWFIDLWAKSYDLPWEQRVAKSVLTISVAAAFGGCALLAGHVLEQAGTLVTFWTAVAALAPPLATLLWSVYDVNWRSVYAGAVVGLLGSLRAYPIPPTRVQLRVAVIVAACVVGLAAVSELRSVKFRRYLRILQRACSCCGYKQRAVHELCALGASGDDAIRLFMSQAESQYETHVRDEWRRCRPRMG